jgi:hypothetical protein
MDDPELKAKARDVFTALTATAPASPSFSTPTLARGASFSAG